MSFVFFKLQYYHKSTPKSDYAKLKWTQKKVRIFKKIKKIPQNRILRNTPNPDGFCEKYPKPGLTHYLCAKLDGKSIKD